MRRFFFWPAAVVLTLLALRATSAGSGATVTFLVSRGFDGGPAVAGASATSPSISSDGRYVAFVSNAINLGAQTRVKQVWVRDRMTGQLRLVSRTPFGNPADQDCQAAVINSTGRYVVFTSAAGNLGADFAGLLHVYLYDLDTGAMEVIDRSSGGQPGDGQASAVAINADGRYVAFSSTAANLVPGDANSSEDVFLRDRVNGTVELISRSTAGVQGDDQSGREFSVAIYPDGSCVAFASMASNLVPGDTNGTEDVFLRDRIAGSTELVSIPPPGAPAGAHSRSPSLSADGRFVAFQRGALVAVRDRLAATTEVVSVDLDRTSAGSVGPPAITPDGRFVVFPNRTIEQVGGRTVTTGEVYLRDRTLGTTERVSLGTGGASSTPFATVADRPGIAADGRFITFASTAGNLVPDDTYATSDIFLRDRQAGNLDSVSLGSSGAPAVTYAQCSAPTVSANGRTVAFLSNAVNLVPGDANGVIDAFVYDHDTRTLQRASVSGTGTEGHGETTAASISPDGRFVAFVSLADDLVSGDTNNSPDVFLRDLALGTTDRVNVTSAGGQAPSGVGLLLRPVPAVSPGGRFVAFVSRAGLLPGDTGTTAQLYLRDRQFSSTEPVSVAAAGGMPDGDVDAVSRVQITPDGRYVAFNSRATNLVASDPNGNRIDTFVRDRVQGTTQRIGPPADQAFDVGPWISISDDGQYVAYDTFTSVFVNNRATGANELISVTTGGTATAHNSLRPRISADGRYVAFETVAPNLLTDDTNARTDVFVRDRLNSTTDRASVLTGGGQAEGGDSREAAISDAGVAVAYTSTATNLTADELGGTENVFLTFPSGDPGAAYSVTCNVTDVVTGVLANVSWTAPPGRPYFDWIGLFREGDPNTSEAWWAYTGGAPSGTVSMRAPYVPGRYQLRYLLNNGRADVKRSGIITVSLPAASSFTLEPSITEVVAGAPLSVNWTAPSTSAVWDWIGLFRVGNPNVGETWWNYTYGLQAGSANLSAPLVPGQYEFRYLLDNGRLDVKRSVPITVTAPTSDMYSLTPSATSAGAGGALSISWTAPVGSSYFDWVGLFRVGDPNTGERWYSYTQGSTSGTLNLTAPLTPGQYEFRYFQNNGRSDVKRSATITVN